MLESIETFLSISCLFLLTLDRIFSKTVFWFDFALTVSCGINIFVRDQIRSTMKDSAGVTADLVPPDQIC